MARTKHREIYSIKFERQGSSLFTKKERKPAMTSTSPVTNDKIQSQNRDPYMFIYEINFSKDQFDFLKAIYPDIKPKKSVVRSYRMKSKETRKKASVIACPHRSCTTYIVELEEEVVERGILLNLKRELP